jgi:hypothetical protein
LSTTDKLFAKVIFKIVKRHVEEIGLLNASQVGFRAHHSTTLTDHVTLNFNNNMYKAAVFLDIEKAFDKTRYLGMLYKLSNLNFSISLIKLISIFLSQEKFRVAVGSEISTPRNIGAGVPQGSFLSLTLYSKRK